MTRKLKINIDTIEYMQYYLLPRLSENRHKKGFTSDVIPIVSYPNTFRRQLVDFAAKVILLAGRVILNIVSGIYKALKINDIWESCLVPPHITSVG